MTRKHPVDLAASVHRRLLNIGLDTGDSLDLLFSRYAIERLLYRLSLSPYANQFVLKGALLFVVWQMPDHRPTRDLDLLGYGDDSAERLRAVFRALCALEVEPDGITFLPDSVVGRRADSLDRCFWQQLQQSDAMERVLAPQSTRRGRDASRSSRCADC
jgi:hypothetical protein